MVDNLGRWTPEPDYSAYPKEKWCDMDGESSYGYVLVNGGVLQRI